MHHFGLVFCALLLRPRGGQLSAPLLVVRAFLFLVDASPFPLTFSNPSSPATRKMEKMLCCDRTTETSKCQDYSCARSAPGMESKDEAKEMFWPCPDLQVVREGRERGYSLSPVSRTVWCLAFCGTATLKGVTFGISCKITKRLPLSRLAQACDSVFVRTTVPTLKKTRGVSQTGNQKRDARGPT